MRLRGNRRGMAGDGAPDMASLAGDTGECVYSTYVYTPAGDTGECVYSTYVYTLAGDTGECVYSTYVYTPAGVKLILKRVRKLLAILDIGSNPPKLLDDHLLYRRRYDRLRVSSANNLPLKKNCGNKLGTLMHQNKCQIICHLKILQNNSARRRYGRLRCTGGVAGNGYSAQLGISCLCIPKTAGNADIWCTRQPCISARSASPGSCTARHGR